MDLLRGLRRIREAVASPANGSLADHERRTFIRPISIDTLHTHANLLVESSADDLAALDLLVEQGDYAISPWVVARASLEASALAVWLLDRSLTVVERVGRSLALRYDALRAQLTLADGDASKTQAVNQRIEEVEQVAVAIGLDAIRNKKGERIWVGARKPSKTELVSAILGSEVLYRILSGVAHSDAVTLSELCFTPVARGATGLIKARAPAAGLMMPLVANVAASHSRAAWEVILRFGGDAAETAVLLEKRFNELGLKDDDKTRFWRLTI